MVSRQNRLVRWLRIDSISTAIRAAIGWPMLAIGVFFLAVLLGSIFPANNKWQQPEDGIDLYIETNGVHVSLILPISSSGEDLADLIQPRHLKNPDDFGTHIMVGWGHAGVYRNAETWADVQARDVWDAATGSNDTLLHIYHRTNPKAAGHRKKLRVTAGQYRFIMREIRATFRQKNGAVAVYPAYGDDNLFYAATGRYSAFHTCNEWIASLLRRAGVRVGLWTPFAGGAMRWF